MAKLAYVSIQWWYVTQGEPQNVNMTKIAIDTEELVHNTPMQTCTHTSSIYFALAKTKRKHTFCAFYKAIEIRLSTLQMKPKKTYGRFEKCSSSPFISLYSNKSMGRYLHPLVPETLKTFYVEAFQGFLNQSHINNVTTFAEQPMKHLSNIVMT